MTIGRKKELLSRHPLLLAACALLVLYGAFFSASARAGSFIDDVGRRVDLPSTPERIVCLAPELTEIMYALGCGAKVVGVTRFSNHPPEAAALPKVGTYVQLNIEQIVTLKPDLVLATGRGNPEATITRLQTLGLPVYTYFPKTIPEMLAGIQKTGEMVGCPKRGKGLAESLTRRFQAIEGASPKGDARRPGVLILFNHNPLIAAGPATLGNTLIKWVGGRNIMAGAPSRYPPISVESLLERRPDVIVLSYQSASTASPDRAFLPDLPPAAVKDSLVVTVHPDLLSRAGPRLVEAAVILSNAVDTAGGRKAATP